MFLLTSSTFFQHVLRLKSFLPTHQNSPSAIYLRFSRSFSLGGTVSHSGDPLPHAPRYSAVVPRGVRILTSVTCSPL
ncbi:hypothetical protein E2C01_073841 [Portunus trituberculatus]|uniref:Uncharacterized protein n=1 Tax=Portunus trituberculatus TaxID=210409 RepID=A0A5B7IBQ6_PORTR|nr:hypothetical protein [Portunus trituberculatus]